MTELAGRLAALQARIAAAARDSGRDPTAITLTAVAKTQAVAALDEAVRLGIGVFGENRVQEAMGHWGDWSIRSGAAPRPQLRLIGPLQTNKARDAVGLFDVIETLDRPSLAAALAREAQRAGKAPRLLIQVNTGREPQKAGVDPDGVQALLEEAHGLGLTVSGLMCIPPEADDPAPHFRLLARLAADLSLAELSMGMSGDFEAAIAAGATHVRLGSALFGARAPQTR